MNRLLIAILLVMIFVGWQKYGSRLTASNKLPVFKNELLEKDTCRGKKMCAVVYLAPWCPACEQVTPELRNFINKSAQLDDYGFLVVIGAGRTHDENEVKAKSMGSNTVIDSDGKIAKSLGVTYFPTFLVIDSLRKIKMRDQEAFAWTQLQFK